MIFWDRVSIGEPDACWLWQASCDGGGYGHVKYNGRLVKAHRLAYFFANGLEPPAGPDRSFAIMHSCDTRRCCNPAHLSRGTQRQNIADCEAKGRGRHLAREQNGRAVLNVDQVAEIRAASIGKVKLSRLYGVSPAQIQRIRAGKQWRDVGANVGTAFRTSHVHDDAHGGAPLRHE